MGYEVKECHVPSAASPLLHFTFANESCPDMGAFCWDPPSPGLLEVLGVLDWSRVGAFCFSLSFCRSLLDLNHVFGRTNTFPLPVRDRFIVFGLWAIGFHEFCVLSARVAVGISRFFISFVTWTAFAAAERGLERFVLGGIDSLLWGRSELKPRLPSGFGWCWSLIPVSFPSSWLSLLSSCCFGP